MDTRIEEDVAMDIQVTAVAEPFPTDDASLAPTLSFLFVNYSFFRDPIQGTVDTADHRPVTGGIAMAGRRLASMGDLLPPSELLVTCTCIQQNNETT